MGLAAVERFLDVRPEVEALAGIAEADGGDLASVCPGAEGRRGGAEGGSHGGSWDVLFGILLTLLHAEPRCFLAICGTDD